MHNATYEHSLRCPHCGCVLIGKQPVVVSGPQGCKVVCATCDEVVHVEAGPGRGLQAVPGATLVCGARKEARP
jgi:hypothetical protein